MSLAYPLVVAFSQDQLAAPVQERINAVESTLLYFQREGASPAIQALKKDLSLLLNISFYHAADAKRLDFENGREVLISTERAGLQEFGYIVSGEVARVRLSEEQQEVIEDLGFEVRGRVLEPAAFA